MSRLEVRTVGIVGAGTMGAGIAQIAAQAGQRVKLHDARPGGAAEAKARLGITLDGLVAKGKLAADAAAAALGRIEPAATLEALADAGLVVEAIVEQLEAKRQLFADLEALCAPDAVLASNTSSLSITAIGRDLRRPERLVGMHFFNPVPLMRLVEVVSGLRTDAAVAESVAALAAQWGKVAVQARSTPGFIVNRIARPFYAEALALLQERAATPAQIDALLRGAGFRMGPCELMDLIGHDVNLAVTESVYAANYHDKRYQPSPVQRELVDGGWLGRKAGRGLHVHPMAPAPVVAGRPAPAAIAETAWLRRCDGRSATELAAVSGERDVAVFDWPLAATTGALAYAVSATAGEACAAEAAATLAGLGYVPQRVADAPGLVVARTVAMLVNEAADAVQQGVCSEEGADLAMTLGVNYPAGPFAWLRRFGAQPLVQLLDHLDAHYRGERYRVSPWLRQRAACQRLGA